MPKKSKGSVTDLPGQGVIQTDGSIIVPEPIVDNGKEVKVKEPKDVRWRRLANRRVANCLKIMRNVQRLANRQQYLYTEEQTERLITLLRDALGDIVLAYKGGMPREMPAELF